MKKADLILVVLVLAAALAALGIIKWNQTGGSRVIVYVDGQETASYALDQDQTVELQGYEGGSNLLVIKDGKASVTEADCPDGLCVHQADIQYEGQTIVCLPHRVVVEVEGAEAPEVDGIVK